MVQFKRYEIEAEHVNSICWHGGVLIDILGGGRRFYLDGEIEEPTIYRSFAYPFDSVVSHRDHAILFEMLGTKGLVVEFETSKIIREINRSYYHAKDYRYPITMFTCPTGEDVIVHCPLDYDTLEIENLDGKVQLTKREHNSHDIFHSDLQASLDGMFLLDRGWVWQPWNIITVYDVKKALEEPDHLNGDGLDVPQGGGLGWEPMTATFCGHKLVTASITDVNDENDHEDEFELLPAVEGVPEAIHDEMTGIDDKIRIVGASDVAIVDAEGHLMNEGSTNKRPPGLRYMLQVYDLDAGKIISSRELPELPGRLMPVGTDHVVSFFDHPKLIEIETGRVVMRWEDIYPGPEHLQPSAMMHPRVEPFIALDVSNNRFAVSGKDGITIIEITGL